MTHYERLGVAADASAAEIRDAYRRAARLHHPDANGGRSAQVMAEVNQAWWVLRDADRRRTYDLSLPSGPSASGTRTGSSSSTSPRRSSPSAPHVAPAATPGVTPTTFDRMVSYQPARFPWRFMAVLASVGILVVLLGVILDKPSKPTPPDNLLGPGSCIVVQPNDDAAEVNCTEPHDGLVEVLVSFGDRCPTGTEPHRDRQGRGTACVRPAG